MVKIIRNTEKYQMVEDDIMGMCVYVINRQTGESTAPVLSPEAYQIKNDIKKMGENGFDAYCKTLNFS